MAVTVVYIDRVAVLNLMVDYLLLMTTATLAGTPLRRLRFGLCAVGGSAYAVAVFLLPVLAHPLCRIGAGEVPLAAICRALTDRGYDGYFALEWEKRWHPELPEPDVALTDFARFAAQLD